MAHRSVGIHDLGLKLGKVLFFASVFLLIKAVTVRLRSSVCAMTIITVLSDVEFV